MTENNVVEPTANEIAVAVLEMLNTLILVDDFPEAPFPENVKEAIEKFNKPELRTSLARRLFHPEEYVSIKGQKGGPVLRPLANTNNDHHCPHACCNGGGF